MSSFSLLIEEWRRPAGICKLSLAAMPKYLSRGVFDLDLSSAIAREGAEI
jgi:hypothetical protein